MAKAPRSLAGKVVVITGGARGIGRATAAALIAQGARVAIGDIDAPLAQQTASELGSGTLGLLLDVTDRAGFDAFLTEVETRIGPIDVLINNAGIMPIGPFVDETDATARRMVDINLHGVIHGSKLAVERFRTRVADALHIEKTRRPTRPSRGAKERRLSAKRHQSERKRQRRTGSDD